MTPYAETLSATEGCPTITLVLDAPFQAALRQIRRALRDGKLSIAAEFDGKRRIQQALGLELAPCRVLLVESPRLLLEATAIDRSCAVFLPLHVVVSGFGGQTLIHILSADYLAHGEVPVGIRMPVARLQKQLLEALEGIAERTSTTDRIVDRMEARPA